MDPTAGGSSEIQVRSAVVIDDDGRAIKNHITDNEDMKLISSALAVISNDDLLIEILLRSPALSIIRWKIVSKRWLSLITTPPFALRRSQVPKIDPPSGLFLRRFTESGFKFDFLPLDIGISAIRSPPDVNFVCGFAEGNVEILQSCNGLLLCCDRADKIYVCNPSINLFKMIPTGNFVLNVRSGGGIGGIRMAFDPTKSPHYKVIHVATIERSQTLSVQIQIYSSETCSWSVYDVPDDPLSFSCYSFGVYCNDAIFWLSHLYHVTHLNLKPQHPDVRSIEPPQFEYLAYDYKLYESRGCLLLVKKVESSKRFRVYEMRNENSEWLLKYHINLDDINVMGLMPTEWCFSFARSFVLGETEDESFLVIGTGEKFFKYNIGLKTLSHLFDMRAERVNGPMLLESRFDGLPFIASFAGV